MEGLRRSTRKRVSRTCDKSPEVEAVGTGSSGNAGGIARWTEEEETQLLHCLKLYGHKNLKEIEKHLKSKSREEIKRYLTTAHAQARKRENPNSPFSFWLAKCTNELRKEGIVNLKDSIQIPQIIKYLSIDGLLESHPLPENCDGIDFRSAYKLLYQALMGYPLQPVSKATADFVYKCLDELGPSKHVNLFGEINKFVTMSCGKQKESPDAPGSDARNSVALKMYQRKRPSTATQNPSDAPVLKIVVRETDAPAAAAAAGLKTYTIGVDGQNQPTTTITVPVPEGKSKTQVEEAADDLRTCKGFNPFAFPERLLMKPPSRSTP